MRFVKILEELKQSYKNNVKVHNNGTLLLGPGTIPRSEHMLYAPLTDDLINEHLISQYKFAFPKEYIEFLKYSNGADLCIVKMWHNIKGKKIPTASVLLSIFGLPMKPPFARPQDEEEPYDVRIEDLARNDKIPAHWLKCGCYTRDYDFNNLYDIFIDTKTGNVYSTIKNKADILDSWESLDNCLCDIYASFSDRKSEYEFVRK
jgi:hypothetical protein